VGLDTESEPAETGHRAAVGSFIAVYAVVDAWVLGIAVIVLADLFNAFVVLVLAAAAISMINIWACSWLDDEWDFWVAGPGKRFAKRLEKMRSGTRLRRPVAWVQRDSEVWFTLAAIVINAITVVALARMIGGTPVGRERVRLAAVGYSIFFATLFTLIGVAVSRLP
jgi:hypothetical protein